MIFLVSNPGNRCGASQQGCRGEMYRVSNTERRAITDLKELARGSLKECGCSPARDMEVPEGGESVGGKEERLLP